MPTSVTTEHVAAGTADAGAADEHEVAPAAAGIASLAASWASAAGSRARLLTDLALAEAKLAAISIALMAFLAMLAAAFILGAWGLLMAGLIFGLIQLQVPLWPMLFVLGGLHILIAFAAWRGAVRLSDHLEFPATRQQFVEVQDNEGSGDAHRGDQL